MSQWKFFNPDYSKKHIITTFDDGNKIYSKCNNVWYICGTWKGKVRVINDDRKTYINSISSWKVIPFIKTNIKYHIPQ